MGMQLLGNIIWVVFGGWLVALEYLLAAASLMLTVVGIPFGWQLLKIAWLALLPFGNDFERLRADYPITRSVFNILWFVFFGALIALSHFVLALLFSLTIVGLPFGIQHWKLAKVALWPFGLSFDSENSH